MKLYTYYSGNVKIINQTSWREDVRYVYAKRLNLTDWKTESVHQHAKIVSLISWKKVYVHLEKREGYTSRRRVST